MRIKQTNKYRPDRIYLYLRLYGSKKGKKDIPLGRLDTKRPQQTIEKWIECTRLVESGLVGIEGTTLNRDDLKALLKAINSGERWHKWEYGLLFSKNKVTFKK